MTCERCGYDKLHIFSVDRVETPNINRIARFCGPKNNGKVLKPFDGARKIKNSWKKDEMAMWDIPFNTYSSVSHSHFSDGHHEKW